MQAVELHGEAVKLAIVFVQQPRREQRQQLKLEEQQQRREQQRQRQQHEQPGQQRHVVVDLNFHNIKVDQPTNDQDSKGD